MSIKSFVDNSSWRSKYLGLAAASVIGFAALLRLGAASKSSNLPRDAIPSPRATLLPGISATKTSALPYPPNMFPGAREVGTPYGIMRVYEWGPEEGKKVVMIHGDTTPAPLLGPIAMALVERGCRVMMLVDNLLTLLSTDLWGRGYSDTPLDVPHDARFFTLQILFAIASSSLSWTGAASHGFSLIGFSLGGSIVMSFAAHFPQLVNSIILLAPAGILRSMPDDYENTFIRFPSLVPASYLRRIVGKILGVALVIPPVKSELEVSHSRKSFYPDVPAIVQWQFDFHKGFLYSFVNTIKYGPIMHQQPDWIKTCSMIRGEIQEAGSAPPSKLHNSKLLVIFGDADGVVVAKEVSEDLETLLGGKEHLVVKMVPGGHGFPVPSSEQIIQYISEFWNLSVIGAVL